MASGDIKGFYRQQKKGAGVSKPFTSSKSKRSGKAAGGATITAGDAAQTRALSTHDLNDEYGEEEQLRRFDLEMRYGPCLGLTRIERWDRAVSMGLNPPPEIGDLLLGSSSGPKPALECLWEGRV